MKTGGRIPKNMTFEKALARLSDVVSELEAPNKELEEALELFEEGVALSRFCRSRISEIEKRVEIVLKESPEGLETAPFESGDGGEDA
ncbi:MAG: exodeoxyribonuclease VII small subunit [Thermoanaerobaculia bacterium]|nr:Exodeoxyribonuclease 7 small subunit [Thermoanaerobaculia bacterium]MCK6682505.1 exodeoxyribonuclease VII small subunit [Thermoanaerobaculia bacterium]